MALADVCRTDALKGNYFLDFKMAFGPRNQENSTGDDFKEIFDDNFVVPLGKEVGKA